MMKRPALFLDRDGVINIDYGYVHQIENFHFMEGIIEVAQSAHANGYLLVIITNQAGIARSLYSETDFWNLMHWVGQQFELCHAPISAIYFCPYHPEHGIGSYKKDSDCRKPKPGMIFKAAEDLDIDLKQSILIGDQITDIEAGSAAGVGKLFLLAGNEMRQNISDVSVIKSLKELLPFFDCSSKKMI